MDLELTDRSALITGSYRGTGLVMARRFLDEGARVFVHGFTTEQAESAAAELGGGTPVAGDVRQPEGVEQLADAVGDTINVLVNNYGTAQVSPEGDLDGGLALLDDWLDLYRANVLTAQRLTARFLPAMRQLPFARIINLGTAGALAPGAHNSRYYTAKAALVAMTSSLAREVAGTNVRVNMVSPGLILTPEVEAAYMRRGEREGWGTTWSAVEAHVARNIPIGRIARREEVADLVLFLASPRADAIHGQNIVIDGGALRGGG